MPRDIPPYDEVLIRLSPGLQSSYNVLITGPDGSSQPGVFNLPFSYAEIENFRLKVDPGRARVRGKHAPQLQLAKEFGEKLFDALVQDDAVRDVYTAARSLAHSEGRGLRMKLSLSSAPELMGLPWEFLYRKPSFLAQSVWTPIVRYIDLDVPHQPLRAALPLRILGMVSSPADDELATLDVAQEREKLQDALNDLINAGQVELRWLEHATMRQLQKEVRHGEEFHVFHYIGHGDYNEDSGEGRLMLESRDGRADYVSGERLATILCDRHTIKLAVLNACEAATTTASDPLAGVATSLVAHEVPAVIGMQFSITDEAAITFAEEFYAALADGYPVDAALVEARRAISADDQVQWATPVLFMRVADGRLFELPKQEVHPVGAQEASAPQVDNQAQREAEEKQQRAAEAQRRQGAEAEKQPAAEAKKRQSAEIEIASELSAQVLALCNELLREISDQQARCELQKIMRALRAPAPTGRGIIADAARAGAALASLEKLAWERPALGFISERVDGMREDGPSMRLVDVGKWYARCSTGQIELPQEKLDELGRLLTGHSAADRLGLGAGATDSELRAAAAKRALAWRTFEASASASPMAQRAASDVVGLYEEMVASDALVARTDLNA